MMAAVHLGVAVSRIRISPLCLTGMFSGDTSEEESIITVVLFY